MQTLPPTTVANSVSDTERAYALHLLTTTQVALHQTMSGLSPAQVAYKPAADRWSIAECLEHIALAETGIFGALKAGMNLPADTDKRAEIKVSDQDVTTRVLNRSATLVAPAYLIPTGQFASTVEALSTFDQQRTAAINYVKSVTGDLRTHYFPNQVFGVVDAYQAVLMLASHGERHRNQIEEVKTTPGFPA